MIRYNTSNDRICKIVRNWCRENSYIYRFDDEDNKNSDVYPFVMLAPSYAERELIERIRTVKTEGGLI